MDSKIVSKLDKFFSSYPSYEFKKGNVLMQPSIEPKGIFYIVNGIVRQYWISENGVEVTLNLYKPNTFIPMPWAIANLPISYFFEAMTDVQTERAPKEDFLKFIKKEPDLVYDLLRRVYIGIDGLWTHLESLTAGSSSLKLLSTLIILGKRFGKKDKDKVIIDLKMSEQEVAAYAGMSRETASREFQKLKKENLVLIEKGMIIISSLEKLEDLIVK